VKDRLFVYGTLKAGCRNHDCLPRGSELLCKTSIEGFQLWNLGPYPCVTRGEGTVFGEVWLVSSSAWPELDEFEGVPDGLYRREHVVTTCGLATQVYVWAAGYYPPLTPTAFGKLIPSGVWKE
jgi:gamma-glutamylcyclotransferase (GGCT)/AIG2-like uncharacterized protein YtfP